MRVLRVAWPVLCAFVCGYSLHDLLGNASDTIGSATAIMRWLVPVVMGIAAIEGVWRGLRATPSPRTSG